MDINAGDVAWVNRPRLYWSDWDVVQNDLCRNKLKVTAADFASMWIAARVPGGLMQGARGRVSKKVVRSQPSSITCPRRGLLETP